MESSNSTNSSTVESNLKEEYILILPQILIVFISWMQLIFSLNRFKGVLKFSSAELSSFYLFIISGACKWVSALSIKQNSFLFQLISSSIGTCLYGAGFVILYNDKFDVPSRQQNIGLFLSLVTSTLWEIQNRLVYKLV